MKAPPFVRRRQRAITTQRGFSLTELAIVLGIGGVIVAGIWTGYSRVKSQQQTVQAIEELQAVSQGMISLESTRPITGLGVNADLTPLAISAGLVPSWAVTSPTTATTPWGGSFYVQYIGTPAWEPAWAAKPDLISIGFTGNIPNDVCVAITLAATNCQYGQVGCPVSSGHASCCETSPPDATTGWQYMTPALATTICAQNYTMGNPPSLGFEFAPR